MKAGRLAASTRSTYKCKSLQFFSFLQVFSYYMYVFFSFIDLKYSARTEYSAYTLSIRTLYVGSRYLHVKLYRALTVIIYRLLRAHHIVYI